jgi:transposase-like protein
VTTTNEAKSQCPHCQSTNTVRIGQTVGKWLHFCFSCGRRFELKLSNGKEVPS